MPPPALYTPAAEGVALRDPADFGVPLPRAPRNVFVQTNQPPPRAAPAAAAAAPAVPVAAPSRIWTNYYELPIEYTVEIQSLPIFNPANLTLATRFMPENIPKRRFLVIDETVHQLYGDKIDAYFAFHKIPVRKVVIPGGEANKTLAPVDTILQELCEFGLHRREPIIAVGGGVVLDIVGLAASLYRRGVPYVRVPTTLLAIVDASVGVKTGVDYVSRSKGALKNRVGTFYPPSAAFLDRSFIKTQDERNIVNGMGEIMKLALVRSEELFDLLERHGRRVVKEKFQNDDGVADKIIELSVQLMLEELGPNLWEYKLERCVDYGHSFSKILEMMDDQDLMHGEAVNVDGFFCAILSYHRGWISRYLLDRIFTTMKAIGLPTSNKHCTLPVMMKGLEDAVEHRHGKQRVPLIKGIGAFGFANDINTAEVETVLKTYEQMHAKSE